LWGGGLAHTSGVGLLHAYMLNMRKYDILFTFSPIYEYTNLDYEHVPVQYRVHQAEYGIHMHVAASREYVNTYSTRRMITNVVWCIAYTREVGRGVIQCPIIVQ